MTSPISADFAYSLVSSELQMPTVFKNMLQNWPCGDWSLKDWADSLKNQKIQFRTGSKLHEKSSQLWEGDCAFFEATMQEFQTWIENSSTPNKNSPFDGLKKDEHWCYADYKYMAELYKDDPSKLQIIDWSNFGFSDRNAYQSTLWIGSEGSFTPCHYDTYGYNLVAQLIGKKRWILFPPSQTNMMQPTRIPYEESSVFSEIDIRNPQLNDYPAFAHTTPFVVYLQPGDVLYVPYHWWHFVESMETSASVNTWVEINKDNTARLEEAITRTLMSAFIEVYGIDDWINPTEKIELPDVNVMYVHEAIKKVKNLSISTEQNLSEPDSIKKKSLGKLNVMEASENSSCRCGKIINHHGPLSKRHRSCDEVQERLHSHNECIIPVPQLSFSEFMNLMGIPSTKKLSIQNVIPLDLKMTKKTFKEEEIVSSQIHLKDGDQAISNINPKNTSENTIEESLNMDISISTQKNINTNTTENDKFKKLLTNCILHPHIVSEISLLLQKQFKI